MTYEKHHVAGRRNSEKTVRICVECHRSITRRQEALGVPLQGTDEEAKRQAALILGYLLLIQEACDVYARYLADTYGLDPDPRTGYRQ